MSQKLTRCTVCQTIYWVTPSQLSARDGLVRCGHCGHVFNALETLVQTPTATPAPLATHTAHSAQTSDAAERFAYRSGGDAMPPAESPATPQSNGTQRHDEEPLLSPDRLAEISLDTSNDHYVRDISALPNIPPQPINTPEDKLNTPPEDNLNNNAESEQSQEQQHAETETPATDDNVLPQTIHDDEPPPPVTTIPEPEIAEPTPYIPPHITGTKTPRWYYLAAIFLTISGIGQFVIAGRNTISTFFPTAYLTIASIVRPMGLSVVPPQLLQALTIEATDLRQDPNNPKRLIFSGIIRNTHDTPVGYPLIVLSLLDGRDAVIVRKILTASDYLPTYQANMPSAFPSRSEHEALVTFEQGDIHAIGFRVHLSYAR